MIGIVLIGIVFFVIVLIIILKQLNGKQDYQVTRMDGNLVSNDSFFDKVKKACCTRSN